MAQLLEIRSRCCAPNLRPVHLAPRLPQLRRSTLRVAHASSTPSIGAAAPQFPNPDQALKESQQDVCPLLKDIGPLAPQQRWGLLASVLYWGWTYGLQMLGTFAQNPAQWSYQKDRSHLDGVDPLPGIQHEYLDVGAGIQLHAVSLGRQPDKPLMLFLHGFPEFWYSWKHQLQHFAKDYDAVAIDVQGFNLSSKPQDLSSYKFSSMATGVARAVQQLGHGKCVLVGHDWGGCLCWAVAGMYPDMVDRLITVAGPHVGLFMANYTPQQAEKSWYMNMHQWPGLAEWAWRNNDWALLESALMPGSVWGTKREGAVTAEDMEWYKHAMSRPGAITGGLAWYRLWIRFAAGVITDPPAWAAFRRRLHMPVLGMLAEGDGAIEPTCMQGLDQVAPTSQFHLIKNCSHFAMLDAPEEVNQRMEDFLRKHPASK